MQIYIYVYVYVQFTHIQLSYSISIMHLCIYILLTHYSTICVVFKVKYIVQLYVHSYVRIIGAAYLQHISSFTNAQFIQYTYTYIHTYRYIHTLIDYFNMVLPAFIIIHCNTITSYDLIHIWFSLFAYNSK